MKFQQMKFREKQEEWFGKRGLSWHISSVVFKDLNSERSRSNRMPTSLTSLTSLYPRLVCSGLHSRRSPCHASVQQPLDLSSIFAFRRGGLSRLYQASENELVSR